MTAQQVRSPEVHHDRTLTVVGWLLVAAGVGLAALRFANGDEGPPVTEELLASVALGSLVAAPGVLVLLARHDRPALLLPAVVCLVPLSFLSFAGVLLPLLIPAALLFVAYRRRSRGDAGSGLEAAGVTILTLTLLMAAAMALLLHEDPRTYVTTTSTIGTSNAVTCLESLLSLSIVAAVITVDWKVTDPSRRW